MLATLKIICLLTAVECFQKQPEPEVHVCDRDWSEKSLEAKIELAIGCGHVNGKQVYYTEKLEKIWNSK